MFQSSDLNLAKARISELLARPDFDSTQFLAGLVDTLGLRELYERIAVREGYTIGEHTIMALNQLGKYFPDGIPGLSLHASRLLIALHDSGKRISEITKEQSKNTPKLLAQCRAMLPLSEQEFDFVIAMVSNDPLGNLFKRLSVVEPNGEQKLALAQKYLDGTLKSSSLFDLSRLTELAPDAEVESLLEETLHMYEQIAHEINVPILTLIAANTAYYQIDICSYTLDAARDLQNTFPRDPRDDPSKLKTYRSELTPYYLELEEDFGRPARGFPTLEGVIQLECEFDLHSDPHTSRIIKVKDNRLQFSPQFESVYQKLLQKVDAHAMRLPKSD